MQKFASCDALLCPALDYLPPNQNFLLSRSSIVPSQCSSHTTPRRQVKYSQQGKCASPLVFCTANSHCKPDTPLQRIPFSFFLLFFFFFSFWAKKELFHRPVSRSGNHQFANRSGDKASRIQVPFSCMSQLFQPEDKGKAQMQSLSASPFYNYKQTSRGHLAYSYQKS